MLIAVAGGSINCPSLPERPGDGQLPQRNLASSCFEDWLGPVNARPTVCDDHARGHRGANTRDPATEKGRETEGGRQRCGPRGVRVFRPGHLQWRRQIRRLRHVDCPQRRVRRKYADPTVKTIDSLVRSSVPFIIVFHPFRYCTLTTVLTHS